MRHEIGVFLSALAAVLVPLAAAGEGEGVARISKEQLGSSPQIVVLDVRQPFHWSESGEQIAGAFREDPHDVKDWAPRYGPEVPIVVYCA